MATRALRSNEKRVKPVFAMNNSPTNSLSAYSITKWQNVGRVLFYDYADLFNNSGLTPIEQLKLVTFSS